MRHITISTTGIFNAIRPPLFPPIEGKETTTFLLGLDFNTGGISPFYDEEQYDKAYALVSFAQDKWRYFEGRHGNIWDLPIAVDPEAEQPTLTEWLTNYTPKFSTIEEYKKALVSWMSYVFH